VTLQIAEELHDAGREVFLSCGRAWWAPRRLGDRDLFWWLLETGHLDEPLSSLRSPAARLAANVSLLDGVGEDAAIVAPAVAAEESRQPLERLTR
jgi:putative flavoprotein involved in K+ transport